MQKRIALLYDFDYTLTDGYMQEFGLMQKLGFDNVYKFFEKCDIDAREKDVDMCLSMMAGTLFMSKAKGYTVSREYLREFGKDITYYGGVLEWFDKINELGKSKGYEIEHYIISSGIKEIIEGTKIAHHFKRIYSNFYAYDDKGEAFWPAQVVNYTSKTQYIFRVRKNVLDDLKDLSKINAKMTDEEMLPFENIIYLGDSETDIPSFKVVKNSGGLSICVYNPNKDGAKAVAQRCFEEGRVNYFLPADYSEGSELFQLITSYIEKITN